MTRPMTSAEFDSHVNELREALGRVDALADALQRTFDERVIDGDPAAVERRISHMIDIPSALRSSIATYLAITSSIPTRRTQEHRSALWPVRPLV